MRAGRVGRPHGLDGSFHVVDPRPDLLVEGVELDGGLGRIVGRKGSDDRPIVRVEAASDRTGAERLRGRELVVVDPPPRELDEDEYLAEDLEGCVVLAGERTLGTVRRLIAYPSCEVLELDDGALIPMVRDCIRHIDVQAKRIDVDGEFLGAA